MPPVNTQSNNKLFRMSIIGVCTLLLLSVFASLVLVRLFQAQKALQQAAERRYQSYLLADQLRQSSDDLTRMVRTYVATGNTKFEKQFWTILAIRNGTHPRPLHYDRIYWDFMAVDPPAPPFPDGKVASLQQLMKEGGITDYELELLKESQFNSDELVELECVAMNAMKGRFKDAQGNFAIKGPPNREMALGVLFGADYHNAKRSIMAPINEFYKAVDLRTMSDVSEKAQLVRSCLMMLVLAFIVFLGVGIGTISVATRYHCNLTVVLETEISAKVHELECSNQDLQEAKELADAANRTKSIFLANMSHEIRTPMNAILGFTAILNSKLKDPQHHYYLNSIQAAGRVLLDLINDILDLSKIEAGKFSLEYSAVSLHELCREVNCVLEQKVADKGLALAFDLSNELPEALLLDAARLKQILLNLLGNAIKFTDQGTVSLTIGCQPSCDTSHSRVDLTLKVADTGRGIPESDYEHIFETFEQAKGQKVKDHGGTGLGLTITKRLVDLMKGTIVVKASSPEGTTFAINLPGVEIAAVRQLTDHAKSDQIPAKDRFNFMPATILIADDVDYNREILASYLEDWQFRFVFAENGNEVIERCEQEHPDVILLDIKMPEMTGDVAAQYLRSRDEFKGIRIVAVTASALTEDEDRIRECCDDYLRKPVSQDELIQTLAKFLPHNEQTEEVVQHQAPPPKGLTREQSLELADRLTALLPAQKNLQHTVLFGELDKFLEQLDELNTAFPDSELTQWTTDLQDARRRFETAAIVRILASLPELIVQLSSD